MYIMVVGSGDPAFDKTAPGLFATDQAKALAAYGHKVVYAAIDLRSIRRFRKLGFHRFSHDGIEVFQYAVPVGAVGDKLLDAVGKWTFAKVYQKIVAECGRPDIVHAHFGDVAVWAADVCQKNQVPFVITEHSSNMNKAEISPELARRCGDAYRKADKVLAVGSALAKNIEKHTGVCAAVMPNMVDTAPFSLRTQPRKAGEPFRFLSSGSLIQRKGFDLLLKAFTLFCQKHDNAVLQIMGGGPEQNDLQKLTKELGIAERITMTGAYVRPEFGEALQQADCYVLATRWETFGVVYIEAMAAGVPVIATRCGGPEDFVTPADGLLVPVEDVQALADAMEHMYQHIGEYDGAAIRENTLRRFSPQTIAQRLAEIYSSLV